MTTDNDKLYQEILGKNKSYIMGVSPYFYSRVEGLGKNWYSSSDSLWYDRLEQVLDVMPDAVEIISWNDFGEAHYIGEVIDRQVIPTAKPYVEGFSHDGYRAILPYYVAAYKAGKRDIPLPDAIGDGVVVASYRTTPPNLTECSDGGTQWGQKGSVSARLGTDDAINIIALSALDTPLTVYIGEEKKTVDVKAGAPRFIQVPFAEFNGARGPVTIEMGDQSAKGPAITEECPQNGVVGLLILAIRNSDANKGRHR